MPKRRRTRAQNRANYVAAERRNRASRESTGAPLVIANDEPPPF
jgi:hypothetical protein